MMRAFFRAALLLVFLAGSAFSQGDDVKGVIGAQIEAFKADDFDRAFTFASPNIQGLFRNPDNFGRMVTQGYPMVWRPVELEFLELRQEPQGLAQRVRIVDSEGRVHLLDYYMIETADGWKINGVQLLETTDLSA